MYIVFIRFSGLTKFHIQNHQFLDFQKAFCTLQSSSVLSWKEDYKLFYNCLMQELAEFLKRHSRKRLSLERKFSNNKASDFSLRKKSSGKSNNRLEITVVDRHHRSINLNNLSTHSIKKGVDVSNYFIRGKSLYKEYKLEEACKQFSKVLASEPDHQQALYLSGISNLNLGRLAEAARNLEKLQQQNPNYKSNVYLLLSICYNKLKNPDKALQYLTTALGKYDSFLEAYCYRAKIYIGLRKYLKAEEDFDMALSIDPNRQLAIVGKADCLRNRGLYKQAIQHYTSALQKQQSSTTLLKRAVVYYENNLKTEALVDIKRLLLLEPTTEAFYYRGLIALEYEKDQSSAILNFEQSIKAMTNQQIASKAAQQLLKIKIEICDFYECTSILQWISYHKVGGLEIWSQFIDGVVSLMKKKFSQADASLKIAQSILQQTQRDTCDYDYLYPLVKLYRAYGEFCLNKYEAAYNDFVEYERFIETVLGKEQDDPKIKYNKLLCQSLMLCDGEFYEQSIEKLRELVEMDPQKIEPYFYQCMVLLKVAFSDLPVTSQYQSRDQIILAVLEIIEEKTHLQTNPSIMFYDGILKAYFNLFQQSQKSLSKAIQKGEQHLAKYFFWRSLVNNQLNNSEQALTDISVSLNIQEKPEYLLARCRLNQLSKKTEDAYEDLQKYIEVEPNQIEVSKWAAIILFINKAYDQSERAIRKVPYLEDQAELKSVVCCLNLLAGKFEEAGLQGMLIGDIIKGQDPVGLDQLILSKDLYGFLPLNYLYFLRVIKNYVLKNYSAAIKDLQYLMFISKDDENFLQIKYNIMVCHLLNGDSGKALSLFKGMQELEQRLAQLNYALHNKCQTIFDDLSDYYPRKRLSNFISAHEIPDTPIKIKISMPFPEFPNPNIELKVSDNLIIREISLEAVEGKAQAPWIRRSNATVQFTSKIENIDVSLRTSHAVSKPTSGLL